SHPLVRRERAAAASGDHQSREPRGSKQLPLFLPDVHGSAGGTVDGSRAGADRCDGTCARSVHARDERADAARRAELLASGTANHGAARAHSLDAVVLPVLRPGWGALVARPTAV